MKRGILIAIGLGAACWLPATPALAVVSCAKVPPNTVSCTIPSGSSAEDIADGIKNGWGLDDFACSSLVNDDKSVRVTVINSTGSKVLSWIIPATTTLSPHSKVIRFEIPLADGPFKVFVTFDGGPEQLLGDGLNSFGEILMSQVTVSTGGNSETGGGLPALDGVRSALYVAALLLAGTLMILLRRG